MAEVFQILDNDDKYSKNCPLGIRSVYNQINPAGVEENKPPSIHHMEEEDQLEWAYKVLKANNANPKHGDVIWIGGSDSYRNQGIHFWDAEKQKIIPMATKIADYGHVPKRFSVGKSMGDFSPDHWKGISYYNNLQPYWSSKKNKWFYPLEVEVSYVSDYYTESE
jgi:hypothetical protein